MASGVFSGVEPAPPIEVFQNTAAFNKDDYPYKVNLSVGVYRTEENKPWVLPVVRKVEMGMANDMSLNKEYLPMAGLNSFTESANRLLLGDDSTAIREERVFGMQCVGGTGAVRMGAELLYRYANRKIVYITDPSWPNHVGVFGDTGYEVRTYSYWDSRTSGMDWDSVKFSLKNAPEGSVFVLQAVAHNPTGVDPSKEQWMEIATIMKERKLFPFFDLAYQGFSSGDLESDAWSVRYFASLGFDMFCAQSFSKNFGLYNDRVGLLAIIVSDQSHIAIAKSHVELIGRRVHASSPHHGARIVSTILNNQALREEWKGCVTKMATRIKLMRQKLYQKLVVLGTPGSWEHVVQQNGMFFYSGLNVRQVEFLTKEYHIYLLKSGRINMCGLTLENMDYVANAIHEAVTNIHDEPEV